MQLRAQLGGSARLAGSVGCARPRLALLAARRPAAAPRPRGGDSSSSSSGRGACSSSGGAPAAAAAALPRWRAAAAATRDAGGAPPPAPPPPPNPVAAIKAELGMQSNQLDADLREGVERAVAGLGYRVTVGQVAARAGVKVSDADRALKALAYDSLAHLEVSSEGEVVYAFERDFVSRIRARSWSQRLRPLARRAAAVGSYLARAAFGTALIVSAVVVWLAVLALTSSRDSDRRDSGYGGYGGRGYVFIDPTDLFLILDPRYGPHTRRRVDEGRGLTFVEAVFSVVFGDGDPNANFQERRWRALGAHIQRLGGVLSAEEMAPFLDPPPLPRAAPPGPAKYEDESFVLPALIRFNGEPFVDDAGRLLYRFPDLQVVAAAPSVRLTAAEAKVPLEREFEFSAASPGQQAGALLLGVVNVVGVITLSTLLADPLAKLALYRQGLGFVLGLLPYLQTYAAAFFAMPLLRLAVDGRRNAAIDERNDARLQAVSLLQSGDAALAAKSAAARELGTTRVLGRADIVYTTETPTDAQANADEEDDFDARLGARGRGEQRPWLPPGRENRIDDVFGRRGGGAAPPRRAQQQRESQEVEVDWGARGGGGGRGRGGGGGRGRGGTGRRDDADWQRLDRW
ncbi:hypothetical protein HT031_004966 [Scenedesmus sp. PABB004]|nr:hypothetical protein HT031_004966 [Scenedesmus sp. PABB004]